MLVKYIFQSIIHDRPYCRENVVDMHVSPINVAF